uniref:ATP synthase subunit a n=1 Tax=Sphaerotheriidae sp. HYS-2012 TaxID=1170231 RepID=I6PD49_9MYRI|nr:ATP synthase F0 subunit 6 [Sphaerotheriidae sp. HYS-2012]AFH54815.1 ATP synthase F0 subunit 6 [Sphaerotheriidae sp. HYS-2012]
MMTNLFSSFEPTTMFNMSLNWTSSLIIILLIPSTFWMISSRYSSLYLMSMKTLSKEMSILLGNSSQPGSSTLFISIFSLIFINNSMGLFPYIFTSTSHLVMTLSLALTIWLALMIYGWSNNMIHMFTHLLPQNTPLFLMSFMVIIETISNLIRPLTLSIRLMANMMAGHLLLTLLGNLNLSVPMLISMMIIGVQFLLLTLESAVAMIQAYVFTILSSLYTSEVS